VTKTGKGEAGSALRGIASSPRSSGCPVGLFRAAPVLGARFEEAQGIGRSARKIRRGSLNLLKSLALWAEKSGKTTAEQPIQQRNSKM
jgi:hypothetical protein